MYCTKVYGRLVCALAVLLTLLLAACCDKVAGGSAEDTALQQASLDGVTIAGVADNMVLRMVKAGYADSSTVLQNFNIQNSVKKGAVVTAYELDSLTLDTTGRYFVDTVYNDSGNFAFKNIELNSPYLLIRVKDSCFSDKDLPDYAFFKNEANVNDVEVCRTLDVIANVNELKNVAVNLLTHVKSYKLRELVRAGVPFAAANKQAEQEILESYGVYEDLGAFESLNDKERSELSYVNQLIAEHPANLLQVDSNTCYWYIINLYGLTRVLGGYIMDQDFVLYRPEKKSSDFASWIQAEFPELFSDELNIRENIWKMLSEIKSYWSVPLSAVSLNERTETLYLESLKILEYRLNYMANRVGLGRCTEQRENDIESYENVNFVCRSGKWQYGFKRIEHTTGMMVDNRDGKTYKTVTYDIGGKQQTWMAENLNFDGKSLSTDSTLKANLEKGTSCYAGGKSSCEANGRLYEWRAAMNFDDKVLKVFMKDSVDTLFLDEKCRHLFDDDYRCRFDKTGECNRAYERVRDMCNNLYGSKSWIGFWDWNYKELLEDSDPTDYQGVCPDGWRLPTVKDWNALSQFIVEQYRNDSANVATILYDEMANGFGAKKIVLVEDNPNHLMIRLLNEPSFVAVPDFNEMPHKFIFNDLIFGFSGSISMYFDSPEMQYLNVEDVPNYEYDFAYVHYLVRCVKD